MIVLRRKGEAMTRSGRSISTSSALPRLMGIVLATVATADMAGSRAKRVSAIICSGSASATRYWSAHRFSETIRWGGAGAAADVALAPRARGAR